MVVIQLKGQGRDDIQQTIRTYDTPFREKEEAVMRLSFIILILLLWFGIALAESVNNDILDTLSASLDRDSARVGSVVMLTLSYQLPEGARVPEEPEIEGLEGLTIIDREVGVDQIRVKLLIDRLTPWRSGPLSLSYLDKEDRTHTIATYPVSLNVLSNLGEKPSYRLEQFCLLS
ncbi:MAG: hypothetical protein V3R28_05560 [Desulfatiglandales bacterium]